MHPTPPLSFCSQATDLAYDRVDHSAGDAAYEEQLSAVEVPRDAPSQLHRVVVVVVCSTRRQPRQTPVSGQHRPP